MPCWRSSHAPQLSLPALVLLCFTSGSLAVAPASPALPGSGAGLGTSTLAGGLAATTPGDDSRPAVNFTFTQPLYNVSVYQNALPRTRLVPASPHMGVALVGGRFPPDPPGKPWVEFRMRSRKDSSLFVVQGNRVGDFYFLDMRTSGHVDYLNREKQSRYVYAVVATYRAGPDPSEYMECSATVMVEVLDCNDNCPIFLHENYNFTVSDDMAVGTALGRVEATDADVGINARVYYTMYDRTQYFRLDPYSGTLYLARAISARSFPGQHRITVQAVERGRRQQSPDLCHDVSRMDVVITVRATNRYAPTLTLHALSAIHTPGKRGTVYAVIKVDDQDVGPGGRIDRIEIVNDTARADFAVRRDAPKEFTLVLRRDIDRMDLNSREDVFVRVWDAGRPARSTLLAHRVQFVSWNQYRIRLPKRIDLKVAENALVNTIIYSLNASVPFRMYNTRIVYRHEPTMPNPHLAVRLSGAVVVRRPLDAETMTEPFILQVEASDSNNFFGEQIATTTLYVTVTDVNDNAPKVRNDYATTKTEVRVSESAPIGHLVLAIDAVDPDRTSGKGQLPLLYHLVNDAALPFGLDPGHPSRIIVDSKLDSELMPESFDLTVRISDRGLPLPRRTEAVFRVLLVAENDNAPVFKARRCSVQLGNLATIVGIFTALDLDHQAIRYSFRPGYGHKCFKLAPTGSLELACPLNTLPTYTTLELLASDGQLTSDPLRIDVSYNPKLNSSADSSCTPSGIEERFHSVFNERVKFAHRIGSLAKQEKALLGKAAEENAHAPAFAPETKSMIRVPENKPAGSVLLKIAALDKDDAEFSYAGRLVYVIARGNQNDTFQLAPTPEDPQIAALSLLRPLDREKTARYDLRLRVCDLALKQRCASRRLRVLVDDLNDCAPVFARGRRRRIFVSEDALPGKPLFLFNATDCDGGRFGRIRFRLRNHRRTFNISRKGLLSLRSKLDRESRSRYLLLIRAFNKAKSPKSSYLEFEVVITDVNDNTPRFRPAKYALTLMEDLPRGAYVTSLHAVDPDAGLHGLIRYRLIGKDANCFMCDPVSGVIRLTCRLNYRRSYRLIATASDQGTPPLQTQTSVDIRVRPVHVNIRPPVFPPHQLHFEATVAENAPIDTLVTRLLATDPEKTPVSYLIIGGSGLGRFRVSEEGAIRTNEVLDHETAASYWLLVEARDTDVTPRTAFSEIFVRVLDVNDNAPMPLHAEYTASVRENSPADLELVRVQAYDLDGPASGPNGARLEYEITDGNSHGFFKIDPGTGLITTTSIPVNRELPNVVQTTAALKVTIKDFGEPALSSRVYVYVTIEDENDNAPWFFIRALQLMTFPLTIAGKNDSNLRKSLGRVLAYDRDAMANGTVTYSLIDHRKKFRLDRDTGHIFPLVSLRKGQKFNLKVRAKDGGRPFKSSITMVSLEVIGRPILPPGASPSPASLKLKLNEATAPEDSEPPFQLDFITASDSDNVTLPLVFWIREERVPVCLETVPLASGDNVHYAVLRLGETLDYEEQAQINFTLCVSNGIHSLCLPHVVNVTDVNEWRPSFDRPQQTVQVLETLPVGSTVIRLRAQDRDPGRLGLQYRIEGAAQQESLRLFKLHPVTGDLTVEMPLDNERIALHVFLIKVEDSVSPNMYAHCLLEVRVTDTNEHSPQFLVAPEILPLTARVRDNSPLGARIIQVAAFDPDRGERNGALRYSITDGNWDRLFRVDDAGYVLVNASLMDVATKSYQLELTVTDNGQPPRSNRTKLIVKVVSLNEEERPKFRSRTVGRTLAENCPVGSVVAEMLAEAQGPVNYRIVKGNEKDLFSIADTTGLVTTKVVLDRERHGDFFKLTVEAASADALSEASDRAVLSVSLTDENDNRPQVVKLRLKGWISEGAMKGAVVHADHGKGPLVVQARDPDFGLNGKLNFEILNPVAKSFFAVDENTYAIRRRQQDLDRERIKLFVFNILVSDRGRPNRLTADDLVHVTVRITDLNDNRPRFPARMPERLLVTLPVFTGKRLLRVGITDADEVSKGQVSVRLRHGNEQGYFRVNQTTGDLSVATDSLPARRNFVLNFEATDGLLMSWRNLTVVTQSSSTKDSPGFALTKAIWQARVAENSSVVRDLVTLRVNRSGLHDLFVFELLNPSRFFVLGRSTGVLMTTGVPVDRETHGPVLKLLVRVSDRARRRAFGWVHVTIEDINDCRPIFVDQPYHAVVLHSASPGAFITKVTAVDNDAGNNGRLAFSLVGVEPVAFQNPQRYFEMRPDSGELYLSRKLPAYVASKRFVLRIRAHDWGRNVRLEQHANIFLQVVTKNTPVFEKHSYQTSLEETAPVGEAVMTLNATSPSGATLIYSIMSGNEDEKFSLDFSTAYNQPSPCVLKTVDLLDYEKRTEYKLKVRVTETRDGLYSQVGVTIKIKPRLTLSVARHGSAEDVNDMRPVFEKDSFVAMVSENAQLGTTAMQIVAKDVDTGPGGKVSYSLEELEPGRRDSHAFAVRDDGRIVVAQMLDYEERPTHEFWLVAKDDGTPRLSSQIPVRVELIDYNDNPPVFAMVSYHVSIADDSLAGSFVVKVAASDADINDTLSYSLQQIGKNGNDYRCFRIDSTSGQILYQPTAARSRSCNSNRSNYTLDVVASDGVNKAVAHVVVLMTPTNRHSPKFKEADYNAFVLENQPPGTHVITVSAHDPDRGPFGQLLFFIMSEEHRWYFDIDPKGGNVTTVRPLDREEHSSFEILVTVQDGGKRLDHALIRIHVNDVNDNDPSFRQTHYRINLIINEIDLHKALFTVKADDIDHGDNATVRYRLHEPTDDVKAVVGIGDTTGEVRLGNQVPPNTRLIRRRIAAKPKLQFWVCASDQGKPSRKSLVEVEMIFMKIKPSFWPLIINCHSESLQLNEWEKVDHPVATCYANTNGVEYKLLNGGLSKYNKDGEWFAIDSKSGVIRTIRTLDREDTEYFDLTVQARANTDPPTFASTEIQFSVQDRNDITPHFQSKNYQLTVPEDLPVRTRLMQIVASDEDAGAAGRFTYSLTPPVLSPGLEALNRRQDQSLGVDTDVRSYFEIDGRGWLRNVRELDRETRSRFDFAVEVANEGGTHRNSTRVQIDVLDINDCPMTWANPKAYDKVEVMENVSIRTVIYKLELTDKDIFALEPVRYWVLEASPPAPFVVEAETGQVMVSGPLDREKTAEYLLEVMATDGKFSTAKPFRLSVQIGDADDNWPVCRLPFRTLEVEEGRKYDDITRFVASDRDIGLNARLRYSLVRGDAEIFSLGAETGILAVTQPLDRETKPRHTIQVNVSDASGHHCLFEARVVVLDVNDNSPIFVQPPAIGDVPENANPSSPVGKVHAVDLDAGLNRRVVYSLGTRDSHFSVDASTGILFVARPLDRERLAVHVLPLVASDRGSPPRSTTMTASIRLLDINDSPPVFERKVYQRDVPEDAPRGTLLTKVRAVSEDIGENAVVRYRLRDNFDLFSVDAESGELRLDGKLDFEHAPNHYLTVLAVDGGQPPLSGQTMVLLRVRDVNDNPPRFPKGGFNASLVENTPPGRLVIRVTAKDIDAGENARVTYRMIGGDPKGHFRLNEASGELRVQRPVDREVQDKFTLLVEARDAGIPNRLSSTAVVRVNVQDLNDCSPQFDRPSYTFVIYVDKNGNITSAGASGRRLAQVEAGKVYASDKDGPGNAGPFEFSIEGGDIVHFKLTSRNDHAVVWAWGPLSTGDQELRVRVTDAGRTPRSSSTSVRVRVLLQSRQPPSVPHLNVTLTFHRASAAPSGPIARVHVRNRGPSDRLRFELTSDYAGLFRIAPDTGRITATASLDAGQYALVVRVSNGSLSSLSKVHVRVVALTEEMLDNAFVLRVTGLSPKLFFLEHKDAAWRRLLGELMRVRENSVYILAVQPAPDTLMGVSRRKRQVQQRLDVLTAVYSDEERRFFRNTDVTSRLVHIMPRLREDLGGAVQVFSDVCPLSGACVPGQGVCRSRPVIDQTALTRINVLNITHTSPRFKMMTSCVCQFGYEGERCEKQPNECARKACQSPRVCVPMEGGKSTCMCPSGRKGDNCEEIDNSLTDVCLDPKCRTQGERSPMMFVGGSYMNWTFLRPNPRYLNLTFSVRTKQPNAPFIKLRWAKHRAIQLYFAKGHLVCSPDSGDAVAVRAASASAARGAGDEFTSLKRWITSLERLDDGKWHRVRFRLALADDGEPERRWKVRLTVDGLNTRFARINWGEGSSRQQEMLMGAEVRRLLHGYTDVRRSFAGCVKDVYIDRTRLPQQQTYDPSAPVLLLRRKEVTLGCTDLFLNSPCAASPCENGGVCNPVYGSFSCKCPPGFQGRRCEINVDPCSTNPCLNGGTCHPKGESYVCFCPPGISGPRCGYGRFCGPAVNPCRNGAVCIESFSGAVCHCTPEFRGKVCTEDVNECEAVEHPCSGRGLCHNSHGSYSCNCTLGYGGRRCERQNLVQLTPDNNSWMLAPSKVIWIVGGIAAVVIIALLLCLVIYYCVKYRREKRRGRRYQTTPLNDLQKGENHPMIQLVTDSRHGGLHSNAHCYDPLLGSGTRNSLVSSTGVGDINTVNYVGYNDFSCPGTPSYSSHRLPQVGEESCGATVGVTASSSQEGSDELDGPPSMHPLAQSTSSTSSNNNTVMLPGMNGRNGAYRPSSGRSKKKAADLHSPQPLPHLSLIEGRLDPGLRVNMERFSQEPKTPDKMKTFRNMEEDYFWDMSDMTNGAAGPGINGCLGEEDELALEDDFLAPGTALFPNDSPNTTLTAPAAPSPALSGGPRAPPEPSPRLPRLVHPNAYLPSMHDSRLTIGEESGGEESGGGTLEAKKGIPMAVGEEDDSEGITPTEERPPGLVQ